MFPTPKPAPGDPVIVMIAAILALGAAFVVAQRSPDGRERTLRLLFVYLIYCVLELIVKRAAHYAWYIYPIKFTLFFWVIASWVIWRRDAGHRPPPPYLGLVGTYLGLAAIQVFNPYQGNVVLGAMGWLSDFAFVAFYFVAFDLFDDVAPVRRWLKVTAVAGVLSAAACFLEQALGPTEMAMKYPMFVRYVYFARADVIYRPSALSPYSEIFAIAAMLALIAARRSSVLLLAAGIAACAVANVLHAVRIVWMIGLTSIALFTVLNRRRRLLSVALVGACLTLAVNMGMDLSDGLVARSLDSVTTPWATFEEHRLWGLMAISKVVSAYPFGVGVGESSAGLRLIDSSDVVILGTHNYITELAGQMSVIGPLLLLIFAGRVLYSSVRATWRAPHDEWRSQVSIGTALFGALTISFFAGGGLGSYPVSDYFWLIAGASMSLIHVRQRRAVTATRSQPRGTAMVHLDPVRARRIPVYPLTRLRPPKTLAAHRPPR